MMQSNLERSFSCQAVLLVDRLFLDLKFSCRASIVWERGLQRTETQKLQFSNGVLQINQKLVMPLSFKIDSMGVLQDKMTKITVFIFTDHGSKIAGVANLNLSPYFKQALADPFPLIIPLQKSPDRRASISAFLSIHPTSNDLTMPPLRQQHKSKQIQTLKEQVQTLKTQLLKKQTQQLYDLKSQITNLRGLLALRQSQITEATLQLCQMETIKRSHASLLHQLQQLRLKFQSSTFALSARDQSIDDLSKQLQASRKQLLLKEQNLSQLSKELQEQILKSDKERNRIYQQIRKSASTYDNSYKTLVLKLQHKQAKQLELFSEIQRLKGLNTALSDQNLKNKQQIASLTQKCNSIQSQSQQAQRQGHRQSEFLQTSLTKEQRLSEQLHRKLMSLTQQHNQLLVNHKSLSTTFTTYQQQRQQIIQLSGLYDNPIDEIKHLISQIKSLQTQLYNSQTRYQKTLDHLSARALQLSLLPVCPSQSSPLETVELALTTSYKTIRELTLQLNAALKKPQQAQRLSRLLFEKEQMVRTLNDQLKSLSRAQSIVVISHQQCQQKIQGLGQQYDSMVEQFQKQLMNCIRCNQQLKLKNQRQFQLKMQLVERNSGLQNELTLLRIQINKLTEQAQQLQHLSLSRLANLQQKQDIIQKLKCSLQNERVQTCELYRKSLQESNKQISQANEQVGLCKSQNSQLRVVISNMQSKVSQLQISLRDCQLRNLQCEGQNKALFAAVEDLKLNLRKSVERSLETIRARAGDNSIRQQLQQKLQTERMACSQKQNMISKLRSTLNEKEHELIQLSQQLNFVSKRVH